MTTTKPPDFAEINALAIEACDMWQEHLSNLAHNPSARAELTRFLEPQRRLFADWATMMQKGMTGEGASDGTAAASPFPFGFPFPSPSAPPSSEPLTPQDASQGETVPHDAPAERSAESSAAANDPADLQAAGGAAHGYDPLRVAQLALRLAELERRVAQLESFALDAARRS